jgi:protocatechuate 3,4-dioxygenase beta subunit
MVRETHKQEDIVNTAPAMTMTSRAALKPTGKDIEGPFYRKNPPEGSVLCGPDEPGEKLTLSGQVLNTSGKPIPGARVELWQADREGNYDIADPKDKDNPAFPYKFRVYQNAGAQGEYGFTSIKPGHYQIGENAWRTGHLHVKVAAPGFQPLTTQLYFAGDEHNDTDGWFSQDRVVTETPQPGGWTAAKFNIVLAKA